MPSLRHEALIELVRQRPRLALGLVRLVRAFPLPEEVTAALGSEDMSAVAPPTADPTAKPLKLTADGVVTVTDRRTGKPVLLVIVEPQGEASDEKEFSWPCYLSIANPRHERRDRQRLAKAQRAMARKVKGSANREKARGKVARVYARITDRRADTLHKLSTRIIRENQTVVIEDLSVRNMVKNHSLARAIADASWSEFRRMLEYKADWHGRTVIAVDRFYPSSKTCSACGAVAANMPLKVREWECARCGASHDRDLNAAKVLLAAGLAVSACGDGARPARA